MTNSPDQQAKWLSRINNAQNKTHLLKEAREVANEIEKSDCHDQGFLLKAKKALMENKFNPNREGEDIFHELLSTRGKMDNVSIPGSYFAI